MLSSLTMLILVNTMDLDILRVNSDCRKLIELSFWLHVHTFYMVYSPSNNFNKHGPPFTKVDGRRQVLNPKPNPPLLCQFNLHMEMKPVLHGPLRRRSLEN